MPLTDEHLDYWGDIFVEYQLAQYMPFVVFINSPLVYWHEYVSDEPPPAADDLPSQKVSRACSHLEHALDELERQVDRLRRIDNGHPYKPIHSR